MLRGRIRPRCRASAGVKLAFQEIRLLHISQGFHQNRSPWLLHWASRQHHLAGCSPERCPDPCTLPQPTATHRHAPSRPCPGEMLLGRDAHLGQGQVRPTQLPLHPPFCIGYTLRTVPGQG